MIEGMINSQISILISVRCSFFNTASSLEIMMNETTLFRRKLTHCFGAN